MRLVNLVNFRHSKNPAVGAPATTSMVSNNQFTCQFNRPVRIKKGSKVCLIHAEINNVYAAAAHLTGVEFQAAGDPDSVEHTTRPRQMVYINIPSLPVQTLTAQSNGGKGIDNHIIGSARTNEEDAIFSTGISVDLHNQEELVLTEMSVEILDNVFDLKEFNNGVLPEVIHRQTITLGIIDPCDCKGKGGKGAY